MMSWSHTHPSKLIEGTSFNKEAVFEAWGEAQYSLALLEGSQRRLENPTLLLSPLITKEATTSSGIEGTQSTVTDVFAFTAGAEPDATDAREVANYRKAMMYAITQMEAGRVLSKSLLNEMHAMLLDGVRRNPDSVTGALRQKTVWIGEGGTPIEDAAYIPPEHFLLDEYMDDMISFATSATEKSLIKSGVAHYQFEAVHPYDDGNGRIGRLLIPLLLFSEKKMTLPILYISGYFEKNKSEYIQALRSVDRSSDFTDWLIFFMNAVTQQLYETQSLVDQIYDLHVRLRYACTGLQQRYVLDFIDFLFRSPIFTRSDLQASVSMSYVTADKLVKDFLEQGFVKKTKIKKGRSEVYAFEPLIRILG
ncbi:hypothetical protein GVX82_05140 [Patescibacteria group bacterium]|jgi:Fic family protein|nr:hypothetical protein [Patescibacteria group bacterium]